MSRQLLASCLRMWGSLRSISRHTEKASFYSGIDEREVGIMRTLVSCNKKRQVGMRKQLFLVYLGGSASGANIELHDIRFVIAEQIEQAFPALKQQWFGDKSSVHMDSYVALHHVDGYRIVVRSTDTDAKNNNGLKLYFVNFGGYFPGKLAEYHDFTVVVASSSEAAKQQAKAKVYSGGLAGAEQFHKDDLLAVDDCLAVDLIDGYRIDLEQDGIQQPLEPDWMGYRPF